MKGPKKQFPYIFFTIFGPLARPNIARAVIQSAASAATAQAGCASSRLAWSRLNHGL